MSLSRTEPTIAVPTPSIDLFPAPGALGLGDDGSGDDDERPSSAVARCSDGYGTLSSLFFSDDEVDLARAQAICSTCGLRDACLSGAVERMEPYGVWGGKLLIDGVPRDTKPRRGRPPNNPRPPLVVDEVPIPPHLVA